MAAATQTTPPGGISVPPSHAAVVSPDDDNDLDNMTRGISFGTAGDLKVVTAGGETVVIPSGSLAAGVIHPLCITRVYDTGTDALDIVAYW